MDSHNLKSNDYLNQGYDFWLNYRHWLTNSLNNDNRIEKTKENIIKMAKEIGIKPTARYFNISPITVRNYLNKND